MPPYLGQTLFELAYYAAIFALISVLTSIELAHYLATLLRIRVRSARALLDRFISKSCTKKSRITFPPYLGQTLFNSRITRLFLYLYQSWRPLNSHITWPHNFKPESEVLAHYLAALYKNPVLRIRALLFHLILVRLCLIWRITRLFLHLYQSWRPLNSRITWPPYWKSESEVLADYLAALFRSESKNPKC